MRAVCYTEYGSPTVLHLSSAPQVHAGRDQVRIAVTASAVNRFDTKVRSGAFADSPLAKPQVPGIDAAGVVDEVGEGVSEELLGSRVFGAGSATLADFAVLDHWAPVPAGLSDSQAAALPTVAETAGRVLALLPAGPGSTIVVDGASGGVGTVLVQLARTRGLSVIGTASSRNHDFLRSLGAIPTTYGPGLIDRVLQLTDHVDGGADLSGHGAAADLVQLTGSAKRVVTIADFSGKTEAVITDGSDFSSWQTMAEVAELAAKGRCEIVIDQVLSWREAARAHELVEGGHCRGKVVLTLD